MKQVKEREKPKKNVSRNMRRYVGLYRPLGFCIECHGYNGQPNGFSSLLASLSTVQNSMNIASNRSFISRSNSEPIKADVCFRREKKWPSSGHLESIELPIFQASCGEADTNQRSRCRLA